MKGVTLPSLSQDFEWRPHPEMVLIYQVLNNVWKNYFPDSHEQYRFRILGRVLDQLYEIPMNAKITLGAMGGGHFIQYEEEAEIRPQLKSSPPRLGMSSKFRKQPTAV